MLINLKDKKQSFLKEPNFFKLEKKVKSTHILCDFKYLFVCILSILIYVFLPHNLVYASGEITTNNYYVKEDYITKIIEKTTVETFLSNVTSSASESLKVYDGGAEAKSTDYIKTGMELKVGTDKTYTLIVKGDVNPDGRLTATDLSKVKQYYVGTLELSKEQQMAADINYTETITILDISQLRMLLVGFEFPGLEVTTGHIIITQDVNDATKEVTIRIEVQGEVEYNKIEVSLDGGETFFEYEGELKITENVDIKVRLTKEHTYVDYDLKENIEQQDLPGMLEYETYEQYMERLAELGLVERVPITENIIIEETTYLVNNIDNVVPNPFAFTASTTTHSITVTAETIDTMRDYTGKLSQDGVAGVKTYEYRISGTSWQTENVFTNLTKNTEYNVYVRATDHAGNITEATNNGMIVKTDDIIIQNSSIQFNYNDEGLTNKGIVVGLRCDEIEGTDFRIQYQIKGINEPSDKDGEWIDSEYYTATENCTIYARVIDSNNQEGVGEYAKLEITNIDKLAPLPFTPEVLEKTDTSIRVKVTVEDAPATETNASGNIVRYTYMITNIEGKVTSANSVSNIYRYTDLDIKNEDYYIYVIAEDEAGNRRISEGITIGEIQHIGLGKDTINETGDFQTVNGLDHNYMNPVIPPKFKAVDTEDATWDGPVVVEDWNRGLVIQDENGNQFVWVPVDGTIVKYEKGNIVWDYGDSAEWAKLTSQIQGDELPTTLVNLNEEERAQIERYQGFYVSRYEMGNDSGVLGSQEGLKVVNGVTYKEAKTYAESMYKLTKVKSGLLTGTMWDTMTSWISQDTNVTNNLYAGNTYETAFTFSGTYATGPYSLTEKRSEYKTGTNVNKQAKTKTLLTTGIVDQFKSKNIYDTAGNVWEYTTEYMVNEYDEKSYIGRGGNYYWQYDKIVAAGTAVREFICQFEGEQRNEGGFRVALFLTEGITDIWAYEDFNRKVISTEPASYKNPVIPAGFAAVNSGANWGNGKTIGPDWNNGLVIEDENGNEFVWVPVDGTNVKYEKWVETGVNYKETTGDDIATVLSKWNENEMTQISKYGGFYVARYEASLSGEGTVESKPNRDIIVNKRYSDVKNLAESMVIKEENKHLVGTGLITGSQWDTIMRWIMQEKGHDAVLVDSTSWGTYGNTIQRSGVTHVKNIYDLAGNAWETTAEKQGEDKRVYRGGVCSDTSVSVAYRSSKGTFYLDGFAGFRMALYVTGPVTETLSVVPVRPDEPLTGTKGSAPIPLTKGNIQIKLNTYYWTNSDIVVTITNLNPNYYMEYRVGNNWIRTLEPVRLRITSNGGIYARLTNSKKQLADVLSYIIDRIDRVAPNNFTPVITNIKSDRMTINASTTDNLSGVETYEYYVDGRLVYSGSSTSYTVTGLTALKEYEIYVRAIDRAGNSTTSTKVKKKTTSAALNPSEVGVLGDFVNYSVTVNGVTYDQWRILHFDLNGHMHIVCYNGPMYTMSEGDGTGSTAASIKKAKTDWATGIQQLNAASVPYKNGVYGYSSRHLGTDPSNPSNREVLDESYINFYGIDTPQYLIDNVIKDESYLIDLEALESFSGDKKLSGENGRGSSWIASRTKSGAHEFNYYRLLRWDNVIDNLNEAGILSINKYGTYYTGIAEYALAPVVVLEKGVKLREGAGDGSLENPWQLTKGGNDSSSSGDSGGSSSGTTTPTPDTSGATIGVIVNQNQTYDGYFSGTYNNPIIPKGFAPINENGAIWGSTDGYKYGLVIQDEKDNQFVWVPVDGTKVTFGRSDFGVGEGISMSIDVCSETVPAALTSSVTKNGGFYIARFEAGIADGMPEISDDTTDTYGGGQYKPVSKQGVEVWRNIQWGEENNDSNPGNGAVTVARSMYPSSDTKHNVISTLIYGVQWDTALKFIGAYNIGETGYDTYATSPENRGNYMGTYEFNGLAPAGGLDRFRQKNIYDMAGNIEELTMESWASSFRIRRGGCYNVSYSTNPAACRDGKGFDNASRLIGFRVALYIE